MRLESLTIQNFRSYEEETIQFGQYTCFVGPNGSGKSAVLAALNILFRNASAAFDVQRLSEQDFHNRNTKDPVVITATFQDLSKQAKSDLAAYVRHDRLVLSARAEFDDDTGSAEVQQHGQRYIISDFKDYFERDKGGALANELKEVYRKIRESYSELPNVWTKADMHAALREYEEAHPELCTLEQSADQFYGWSRGVNRLASHFQWVFVQAVKDPQEEETEGRSTALGQLLARTVRSRVDFSDRLTELRRNTESMYETLLQEEQGVLKDLSDSLQTRLREWAHPTAKVLLRWASEPGKSVAIGEPMAKADIGEGQFLGDVARLGHGLQRTFLVTLLHVLAEHTPEGSPRLILGFEEPELYQHPPQARHLASTLETLARDDAQVIVTSHSPYFVSGRGFESVRMVRKARGGTQSRVAELGGDDLASSLTQALGSEPQKPSEVLAAVEQIMQPSQNELFFSRVPVLVEGPEDVAFLSTAFQIGDRWTDFRRLGCHFVVCGGKTNMSRPLAISNGLAIPAFVVCDGDTHQATEEKNHRRDNECLLRLCGEAADHAWPEDTYWGDRIVIWKENLHRAVVAGISDPVWTEAVEAARQKYGLMGHVSEKNGLLISGALLELVAAGHTLPPCLPKIVEHILTFAEEQFE